ncbi:DUF2924 domain-containing protein [Parasphingorhabdus sp.]|uniref:DUF2924 domain-containing protein n=1 Tax=Parasphingorhabdus sp. TaxID=2709688 RepID=UPI003D26ECDE
MSELKIQMVELADMSPAQLRLKWRDIFRKPAPEIAPDLLRRAIAWRLQQRHHGGLTASTKKQIVRLQKRLEKSGAAELTNDIALKSGTRLVRTWNGKSYHVLVGDEGFEYDGKQFGSLSHIAEEITGAHWSGPRFFGLKKRSRFKVKAMTDA